MRKKSLIIDTNRMSNTFILVIGVLLIIVSLLGISFAFFQAVLIGNKENTITSGTINFIYNEPTNNIIINNATPVTDEIGKASDSYFEFNVSSSVTGILNVSYYIYFTVDPSTTITLDRVKMNLTTTTGPSTTIANEISAVNSALASTFIPFDLSTLKYSASSNNYLLYTNSFNFSNNATNQIHHYRYRIWLDQNNSSNSIIITENGTKHEAIINGGTFKSKISVYGINGTLNPIVKP